MFLAKNIYDSDSDSEMVKYEQFYECSYVEESHSNYSISETRKSPSLCKKLEIREK